MKVSLSLAAAACALPLFAKIELATPFADGAVLQRERAVPVWGRATPGSKVVVTFAGARVATTAAADGTWRVDLPAMAASKESRTLRAAECEAGFLWDTETSVAEAKDVLVGEVWIASGQSNMECPIWSWDPHFRDGWGPVTMTSTDKPFVRLVRSPRGATVAPRLDFKAKWVKMTPKMYTDFLAEKPLPGPQGYQLPSAIGYYFALELANALDIPVGLVDIDWGGTSIDPWTPPSGYRGHPNLKPENEWKVVPEDQFKPEMCKGVISDGRQQPGILWNGMVAAYAPMACRGVIWYQGCHNAKEADRYCEKMEALYEGWTNEFRNASLKFYFSQLAPWGEEEPGFVGLQLAQAEFARKTPNAAMAVINDAGNLVDIHPNDKRTVAKRLALHALRRDYGWTGVRDNSPTVKSWKVENGAFVLSFNDAEGFYVYNPDMTTGAGFEVCGADGAWKPAKIRNLVADPDYGERGSVAGKTLVVGSDEVKNPVKLRYLFRRPWFGAVYSDAALPLGVFEIENKN